MYPESHLPASILTPRANHGMDGIPSRCCGAGVHSGLALGHRYALHEAVTSYTAGTVTIGLGLHVLYSLWYIHKA